MSATGVDAGETVDDSDKRHHNSEPHHSSGRSGRHTQPAGPVSHGMGNAVDGRSLSLGNQRLQRHCRQASVAEVVRKIPLLFKGYAACRSRHKRTYAGQDIAAVEAYAIANLGNIADNDFPGMHGVDSFGTRYAEGYFLTYGIIVVLEHKGRTWRLYIHAIGRKPRREQDTLEHTQAVDFQKPAAGHKIGYMSRRDIHNAKLAIFSLTSKKRRKIIHCHLSTDRAPS